MLDNCRTISPCYRIGWTLGEESVSIALEAAVELQNYLAFGWADPKSTTVSMTGTDVTIAGFTEVAASFAEDFYITSYSECFLNKDGKVEGVCPDGIYKGSDPARLVNDTRLIWSPEFVRFDRPLNLKDDKYDVAVDRTANMTVRWG